MLVLGTMLATAGAAAVASAQASDPVFGTWVLNVAKSTYSPGPGPKSSTRTYTAVENGYKFASKGIDAQGKPAAAEFTAHFDGKYYPMTGSTTVDSIMVKRIDANHTKSTQKKGNKVVIHTSRVISKDGKTLTATATGKDAAGKAYKNVELFDRK
jgi:hypothetical protein